MPKNQAGRQDFVLGTRDKSVGRFNGSQRTRIVQLRWLFFVSGACGLVRVHSPAASQKHAKTTSVGPEKRRRRTYVP